MQKSSLIGISIITVALLILGSLSNVIGYQMVQSSNQEIIKAEVNQKQLLFQTILDITNNKEIQRIILNSETKKGELFNPSVRFSILYIPVFTKNQLQRMYLVGLMLSKIIKKSKIHSMVEQYQLNNQGMQKEITDVIEKDATLNREIAQLSNSKCDCENENITSWNFPVLCAILFPLVTLLSILVAFVWGIFHVFLHNLLVIVANIGLTLNCFWIQ